MFYCKPCGDERDWPTGTFSQSYGPCELCRQRAVCDDVPSSYLPTPRRAPIQATIERAADNATE